MNDAESRFLELAKFSEELESKLQETRSALEVEMKILGHGAYLQDPTTLTVYKVVKPKGRFTYYQDWDYVRTAQGDERAGTLSKKDAEASGFQLKK